jgi:hypothetical protein
LSGYNYITFAQLIAALLQRLQDIAGAYTSAAEAQVYVKEALRVYNANTATWNQAYQFDFAPGDAWKSLNVAGSPRQRTVTDSDVYTQMEYMLLEPASGSVWTGTKQFNITNFAQALQFRRDALLQLTGANVVRLLAYATANSQITVLTDSTLDLRRVRWIPDSTTSSVNPYALDREDVTSVDAYGDLLPIEGGSPDSWMITANTPLQFSCSQPPNVPGQWDMLALYAENALAPPAVSVLGLPDDWCWVAMYGALADCLSNSPEATDQLRAKYCQQRYDHGVKAMMTLPWLIRASIASLPVDTPSFREMDSFAQNWENTWSPSDPQVVVGGMDFIALAPFAQTVTVSSILTLVGNAPVDPAKPVQLTRDAVDAVLNYAQHLASFKMGGADFMATMPLYHQFEQYCASQNRRYAALGIFRPEMLQEGGRGGALDPRFGPPKQEPDNG